jgi:putative NADPH-quinone reductase
MVALVVVAHPCSDSFGHATARAACDGLRRGGHAVELIDLYADGFAPAMTLEERLAYDGPDNVLCPTVERYAGLVRAADTIVFVYPTWWSGLPAILKGWLDRVLVPGVGFVLDERTRKVRPGLSHVRRIVGISSYGAPRWYVKLVNDNGRRTICRALRMSCGVRARTAWMALYALDTLATEERLRFLDSVERRMEQL